MGYLQRYKSYIIIILLFIGLFLVYGLNYLYDENEEVSHITDLIGKSCLVISTAILINDYNKKETKIVDTFNKNEETDFIKPQETVVTQIENHKVKRINQIDKIIKANETEYLGHAYNNNDIVYYMVNNLIEERKKLLNESSSER